MTPFRLTREIPMWSGPRRSPVPVIAPAGEQRAGHIPQDLPRPRAEGETMRSKPMILVALLLAAFLVNLDTTLVNVALPAMVRELDATTTQLQWVVDSFNLVFAALLLLSLTGIAIFALLSWLTHLALRRWHESAIAREA